MNRDIGEKSSAWKGEKAGYVAKHSWLVKHYGNANKCEKCNSKTAKRYEWANVSGEYKREISDYIQLCPSCHRRRDYGDICKHGHKFTEQNTRHSKQGWRICKQCQRDFNKNYRKRKNENNKI